MMAWGNKNTNQENGCQLKRRRKKERIEVGHLMTKVVVGFLCEGRERGIRLPS
jgi:hypothetical protein